MIAVVPAIPCSARSDVAFTRADKVSGAPAPKRPAGCGAGARSALTSASARRERATSVACTRSSTSSATSSARVRPSASSGASKWRQIATVARDRQGSGDSWRRGERPSSSQGQRRRHARRGPGERESGAAGSEENSPRLDRRPSCQRTSSTEKRPPASVPRRPVR
jgi:hypothetical protein